MADIGLDIDANLAIVICLRTVNNHAFPIVPKLGTGSTGEATTRAQVPALSSVQPSSEPSGVFKSQGIAANAFLDLVIQIVRCTHT
eukprot:1928479-Amphidinium_carterae.1